MNISTSMRAVTACAALGLTLGACASTGEPVAQSGPQETTADASPSSSSEPTSSESASSEPSSSESAPAHTSARQTAASSSAARPGSGHGLCFDLNSGLARDAIATLGPDSNGGSWAPQKASEHRLSDGCGLDWLLVTGTGFNDATATSRVLLFADGRFLGTVEPHEYSYTSIAGDTRNSVTVRYRWLRKDDPFCCPQGGPSEVTATLSDGKITKTGQFPPPSA